MPCILYCTWAFVQCGTFMTGICINLCCQIVYICTLFTYIVSLHQEPASNIWSAGFFVFVFVFVCFMEYAMFVWFILHADAKNCKVQFTWTNIYGIYKNQEHQGSRSGTRLPPLWPWFDSRTRCHMWVEFVVASFLAWRGLFPGTLVFPSPQKPTFLNSNLIGNACTHMNKFFRALRCYVGK